MWFLRIYGVVHTLVWIPIVILVLIFGHTTPGILAIILAGAFGPTALIALDCAVITYYSRQISPFWKNEGLPAWVTNFGTALGFIWAVYRHGASWGSLQYLEKDLESEAERATFSEALVARAMAVIPDNIRQIKVLVRRGNLLAAQAIVERAEAKLKRKSERSRRQDEEAVASRANGLLAKAKSLGIEGEVAALLNQGDGGDFEAAEDLIAETASKHELRKVLDLLEERIAKVPRRCQQDLRRQVENLAQCVYPSRDFRKALYALEKELAVAETARV